MYGIFIRGHRPKTKKQLKEVLASRPEHVVFEGTSVFGDEPDIRASEATEGTKLYFVGPDPYTKRNFFGQAEYRNGKWMVK